MRNENLASLDGDARPIREASKFSVQQLFEIVGEGNASRVLDFRNGSTAAMNLLRQVIDRDGDKILAMLITGGRVARICHRSTLKVKTRGGGHRGSRSHPGFDNGAIPAQVESI